MRIFITILYISIISCNNISRKESSHLDESLVITSSQKIFNRELNKFVDIVCQLHRDSAYLDIQLIINNLVSDSRRYEEIYRYSISESHSFVRIEYDVTPNGSYSRQILLTSDNNKLIAVYHDDSRIRSHGREFDKQGNFLFDGTWFRDQYFSVDKSYSESGPALVFSQKTTYKNDSLNSIYDVLTITDHQSLMWDSITGVYCSFVSNGEKLQLKEIPKTERHIPCVTGQNSRIYWKDYWFVIMEDSTLKRFN